MQQIATNHFLQHRRQASARHGRLINLTDIAECLAHDQRQDLEYSYCAQLCSRVLALPETVRLPLLLAVQQGLSYTEIAERLHCTVAAVKMRIARARALLRENEV